MFNFLKKLFGNPAVPEVKEMKPPVIEPIQPVINTPPQVKVKTAVKAVPAKKNHHQKKDPAKITSNKDKPKNGPAKPKTNPTKPKKK